MQKITLLLVNLNFKVTTFFNMLNAFYNPSLWYKKGN
jgi:hypothetical protein